MAEFLMRTEDMPAAIEEKDPAELGWVYLGESMWKMPDGRSFFLTPGRRIRVYIYDVEQS